MKTVLPATDLETILSLRVGRALDDIEGHRLPLDQGVILVTCGDADRFYDIFTFKGALVETQCADKRIHLHAMNGGAIRLAKRSGCSRNCKLPTDGTAADRVYLTDIRESREIKKINTIALYVHAPCGKANTSGISVLDTVKMLFDAKRRIKAENEGAVVACFMHVDYPDGRKKTYFASRKAFDEWVRQQITPTSSASL